MIMASGISILLLFFIGGVHVYWAFGGKWGGTVAIPTVGGSGQPTFRPGAIATIVVALLLFSAALLLGIQAKIIDSIPPYLWVKWGSWICATVFGLRAIGDFKYVGLFKRVKISSFAKYDTLLFTPLCLWLCLTFYLAIRLGG